MSSKENIGNPERPEIKRETFVLLLGPSGAGKNTVINSLKLQDDRISFVSPLMDRPLRLGETEKISISPEVFTDLEDSNFFLAVNKVYGNRYGTPRTVINDLMRDKRIPILDFPLHHVDKLGEFEDRLLKIYIAPPSLDELKNRLSADGRAIGNDRYSKGEKELLMLVNNRLKHPNIDHFITNKDIAHTTRRVINLIYQRITS